MFGYKPTPPLNLYCCAKAVAGMMISQVELRAVTVLNPRQANY
jgi:hypothetical protein